MELVALKPFVVEKINMVRKNDNETHVFEDLVQSSIDQVALLRSERQDKSLIIRSLIEIIYSLCRIHTNQLLKLVSITLYLQIRRILL